MRLSPNTAIIFDLDGTLIDSAPDIVASANRALRRHGYRDLTFAQITSFVGNGTPKLVERLLAAAGENPTGPKFAPFYAGFLADYETAHGLTKPYPGVHQALTALQAAGHRLGLCTNKPLAPTRALLRHFDLERFFPVVYAGDSLPQRKPDPAPLLATLADLGGGAALFVGDSEVDAETAVAAGLPFALYTEGYRKCPVETLPHQAAFSHFDALPEIVTQLFATA